MSILIPYIFINYVSFPFVSIFKRKFGEIVPFALIVSTLFLYIGGAIQNVKLGFYLLIFLVLFLYIYLFIKKKITKESLKLYLSLGFFTFTLLYFFVSIYHRFSSINVWDEFTLWAPSVKETIRLNKFYSSDGTYVKIGTSYHPFIILFETLWCFLCRRYEDRFLFRAMSTFCISMFMPAIDRNNNTTRSNINKITYVILSISLIIIINITKYYSESLIMLQSFFETIYVDACISISSAYGLFLIYDSKKYDNYDIINITLTLSMIMLLKQVSIGFALLIIIYMIIVNLKNRNNKIRSLIPCILVPFLFFFSWFLVFSNYTSFLQSSFISSSIPGEYAINSSFYNTSIAAFINKFFHFPILSYPIHISYFVSTILFSIILYVLIRFYFKKDNFNCLLTFLITYFGSIMYAICMLMMYLFIFPKSEAINAVCFERYMATYVLLIISLISMIIIRYSKNNLILLVLTCLLFSTTVGDNWKLLKIKNEYTGYQYEYEYQEMKKQIDKFVSEKDKVLVICQTKDNFIELYTNYYMYPSYSFEYIALGKQRDNNDSYRLDISIDELKEIYNKYDFVYTFNTDEEFYSKYWDSFQEEYMLNNRLYTINNGKLTLVPWFSSPEY